MSVAASSRSRASVTTVDDSSLTMVVALDVGTICSGYAYGIRKEMDENMDSVILNGPWASNEKHVSTFKTPTYLLLNEKREFEAFGYEAERRYRELHQQGRHQRCYFFKRFKTKIATNQAGIPGERLKIALEAEVASVFCQYMKGVGKLPIHSPGATYVVADLGGGKTDVVFHQKRLDGHIKEMNKGGGCLTGSSHIDNAFLQLLVRVLGAPAVREFIDECKLELLEFLTEFDKIKHQITKDQKTPDCVGIPVALERICRKVHNGESMGAVIAKTMFRDKIKVIDNKLFLEQSVCYDLFRSTCAEIARSIKTVLSDPTAKGCSVLILVGGMASSQTVQEIIKDELEGKTKIQRIIVPPEPELATLKGAVMFGHQPRSIFQRVIRYTYGLRKAKLFNPDVHPQERLVTLHGIDFITDVFCPFISAGSRAPVGFMSYDSLTSIEPFQKVIEIDVYFSTELNPTYVTDKNVWLLGKIEY